MRPSSATKELIDEEARRRFVIFSAVWGSGRTREGRISDKKRRNVCAEWRIPMRTLRRIVQRQVEWDCMLEQGCECLEARFRSLRVIRASPEREQDARSILPSRFHRPIVARCYSEEGESLPETSGRLRKVPIRHQARMLAHLEVTRAPLRPRCKIPPDVIERIKASRTGASRLSYRSINLELAKHGVTVSHMTAYRAFHPNLMFLNGRAAIPPSTVRKCEHQREAKERFLRAWDTRRRTRSV
jgi:hypothetical protein